MVKKTLLSLAIAASAAGMAGCNISSVEKHNNDVDLEAVDAGKPGSTPARVAPVFSAANKQLPLFNDLLFAEAAVTDGTASADDNQAPVTTALNSIDGAPVSHPIDIEFNADLDPDSLNKPFSVVLIKLRNSDNDADIDALDLESIAANSPISNGNPNVLADVDQPVLGVDYTVSFIGLDANHNPTLRINLLKPLDERSKYIVALTSHLKADGESVGPSPEYQLLSSNLQLPSTALQPVREAVQAWEGIAKAYLAGAAAKLNADAATAEAANMAEAAAQARAAASLASSADVVLSYAFTTGGTTSTLKMLAAPQLFVSALANKPSSAKSLFLAAQAGGFLQTQAADPANPTPEEQQQAQVYAFSQWMSVIVSPVVAADDNLVIVNPAEPTAAELAAVEATTAYQTAITSAASNPAVTVGIAATLYKPTSQAYDAIPGVALTPAQVFPGTALAADNVTQYQQGALTLKVGLDAPALTNPQALASGDPQLISNAVKLSFASDDLWTASPALNPPSDNKKFDPTTGKLTSEGVQAVIDANGTVTGYSGGMTNVTYRYPLADLSGTEHAPVLVTLPGDYTLGGANPSPATDCTQLQNGNGYPVIVYLHGITSDRTSSVALSQSAAMNGCYATIAMDLPLHGVAPLSSDRNGSDIANGSMVFNVEQINQDAPFANAASDAGVTVAERHFNIAKHPLTNARIEMQFGETVATSVGKSGDQFINLGNMGRLRDNMRQAVVDNMHLLASLEAIGTAHGVKLDADKVYVAGLSLGAIIGTTLTAVVNDPAVQTMNSNLPMIQGALLSSPGGSLPKMLENSPAFAPTVLTGLNLPQDSSSLQKYEGMMQASLASVDPVGFAQDLGAQDTPVLMFSVVGGGDCPGFIPRDAQGDPTTSAAEAVSADCSDGATQRLPSGMALAFQGKYPADHVVPNRDYFAAAASNPFAAIMPGLTFDLGDLGAKVETQIIEQSSAATALAGTNPLADLAGLAELDATTVTTASGGKYLLPFDKATHVTFAAADDTATFKTMMTQMLTFFTSNGAALSGAETSGIKPAE